MQPGSIDLSSQQPPGMQLFPWLAAPARTRRFHELLVLFLTFTAFAAFHASRRPPTIVKSVLTAPTNQTGWAPFDEPSGLHRLGELDLSFLMSYAVGMHFARQIGNQQDLRVFLSIGMMGSGLLVTLFGFLYFLDLHSFAVFASIQILCGFFQSIGWSCVVALIVNWFGRESRGIFMGLWSSNTSVGNIVGNVIASSVLGFGWGWSFVVPGILIMVFAVFIYLFLVVHPQNIGLEGHTCTEVVALLGSETSTEVVTLDGLETSDSGFGFLDAWRLPNVATYALCTFISRLVAYAFMYWLPFYITQTPIDGVYLSSTKAGILSTVFYVGEAFGGISAVPLMAEFDYGLGLPAFVFQCLSILALFLYRYYGSSNIETSILLMFPTGFLIHGQYSLLTSAVAADLATQEAIRGNAKALATVSAIIDSAGSLGAALGPALAGYILPGGWNSVFAMLIVSTSLAGHFLRRTVKDEFTKILNDAGLLGPSSILVPHHESHRID